MKSSRPRSLLLAAAALLAAALAPAPARADLLITQKVDGMGAAGTETTTKIKGDKMRVDATPEISVIVDVRSGDMVNLMHAQKAYLKVNGDMAKTLLAQMKQNQGGAATAGKPELKATGAKETINGYACDEYAGSTANGMKFAFMLTKALPNYEAALRQLADAMKNGPLAQQTQGMGLDFGALPGFPLRTTMEVAGQKVTSTVTNVSTAALPDADFTTPTGYQEMAMPTMTPPTPTR